MSSKVRKLVDEISQLNLLEVSELCKVLKVRTCFISSLRHNEMQLVT